MIRVFIFVNTLLSGAGFARDYEKVDDFGHFVRIISALPFAPPDHLDEVLYLQIRTHALSMSVTYHAIWIKCKN